jgi:hypothetical protein
MCVKTIFIPTVLLLALSLPVLAGNNQGQNNNNQGQNNNRAPRKIGAAAPTPQNCRQMIPFRSRSDS